MGWCRSLWRNFKFIYAGIYSKRGQKWQIIKESDMRKPSNNWVTCNAVCHGYPASDYSWHISRWNYIPRRNLVAPEKCKVIRAVINDGDRGKSVDLQAGTRTYELSHLKDIGVRVGQTLTEGQLVGIMGDTGKANGVHLHLVIKINGRRVPDPDAWLNTQIAKQSAPTYYIVRSGDTASGISAKYKISLSKFKLLNPTIKDINLIYPGQKVRVS
jgi:LysM repeat protein